MASWLVASSWVVVARGGAFRSPTPSSAHRPPPTAHHCCCDTRGPEEGRYPADRTVRVMLLCELVIYATPPPSFALCLALLTLNVNSSRRCSIRLGTRTLRQHMMHTFTFTFEYPDPYIGSKRDQEPGREEAESKESERVSRHPCGLMAPRRRVEAASLGGGGMLHVLPCAAGFGDTSSSVGRRVFWLTFDYSSSTTAAALLQFIRDSPLPLCCFHTARRVQPRHLCTYIYMCSIILDGGCNERTGYCLSCSI